MSELIHKVTVQSPFAHSSKSADYANSTYYQWLLAGQAMDQLVNDPFDTGMDLREASVVVTVHKDGLHATAEVVGTA